MSDDARRTEFGDFQTPPALTRAVCRRLAARGITPASVIEPTCGRGAFLAAAAAQRPAARRLGVELDPAYAAAARALDPGAEVIVADAFTHDWHTTLAALPAPVLVLGNPPWVTSAGVAAVDGANRPARTNPGGLSGLDAVLGASNFDVSEWLTLRLLDALGERGTLALLLKTASIRRVCSHHWQHGPSLAEAWGERIDARRAFDATVDAALFVARLGEPACQDCTLASHGIDGMGAIDAITPTDVAAPADVSIERFGWRDGGLVADPAAYDRVRDCLTDGRGGARRWRSGIKHDCARVFELRRDGDGWRNGFGEPVDVEPTVLHPLLKSADVAHDRPPRRALLVPQRGTDEDPARLAVDAPRAWAYLCRHGARLDRRKSSIYRGRPRFSIFGVGDYAFTPWKVAVSGLYPTARFRAVGPRDGRAVVFDDTVYVLPCADEAEARALAAALEGPVGRAVIAALAFPDAKRTVTAALLARIDLDRLRSAHEQPPPDRADDSE